MASSNYTPDNTRSSVIVIALFAAAVTLIAVLIGLSDKPEVTSIGIVAERIESSPGDTDVPDMASDTASDSAAPTFDAEADELSGDAGDPAGAADASSAGANPQGDEAAAVDGTVDSTEATPTPIPTATPEPTAEIAAAVEPTEVPAQASTGAASEASAAAAAPISPGTVFGTFFTRADEDEGATVQRNEVSLTINEDGTGSFTGSLDLTMPDATQITFAMSGPLRWTTESPNVAATLAGSYSYDSPIDLDDITANDAELVISSLGSGAGSLCFPTCFGFRFPPQTGF